MKNLNIKKATMLSPETFARIEVFMVSLRYRNKYHKYFRLISLLKSFKCLFFNKF